MLLRRKSSRFGAFALMLQSNYVSLARMCALTEQGRYRKGGSIDFSTSSLATWVDGWSFYPSTSSSCVAPGKNSEETCVMALKCCREERQGHKYPLNLETKGGFVDINEWQESLFVQ